MKNCCPTLLLACLHSRFVCFFAISAFSIFVSSAPVLGAEGTIGPAQNASKAADANVLARQTEFEEARTQYEEAKKKNNKKDEEDKWNKVDAAARMLMEALAAQMATESALARTQSSGTVGTSTDREKFMAGKGYKVSSNPNDQYMASKGGAVYEKLYNEGKGYLTQDQMADSGLKHIDPTTGKPQDYVGIVNGEHAWGSLEKDGLRNLNSWNAGGPNTPAHTEALITSYDPKTGTMTVRGDIPAQYTVSTFEDLKQGLTSGSDSQPWSFSRPDVVDLKQPYMGTDGLKYFWSESDAGYVGFTPTDLAYPDERLASNGRIYDIVGNQARLCSA
ncbi:MAG: hypothetical protein HY537_15705 [Deltaproteobacteria bacterium]|nr:hypothetical protein [Deltaproteobacteria bacterium]